ncbi:MAG TPA: hypothetical protein VFT66_26620 [Roseiflexaceae bacterium]|jgi:hypothetical protein|nr:hypothetical protein [Roseiflexaceae bacterium]
MPSTRTELITRAALAAAKQSIPLMVTLKDMLATTEDSVTFECISNYQRITILGGFVVIERGERKLITVRGKPAFRDYVIAQLQEPGTSVKQLLA